MSDHADFFSALEENNLTVLITFPITKTYYPDLSDDSVRRRLLLDFQTFLQKTIGELSFICCSTKSQIP